MRQLVASDLGRLGTRLLFEFFNLLHDAACFDALLLACVHQLKASYTSLLKASYTSSLRPHTLHDAACFHLWSSPACSTSLNLNQSNLI